MAICHLQILDNTFYLAILNKELTLKRVLLEKAQAKVQPFPSFL